MRVKRPAGRDVARGEGRVSRHSGILSGQKSHSLRDQRPGDIDLPPQKLIFSEKRSSFVEGKSSEIQSHRGTTAGVWLPRGPPVERHAKGSDQKHWTKRSDRDQGSDKQEPGP